MGKPTLLININSIKNKKLIKFDNKYEFGFIDIDNDLFKIEHPVSDYYLKLNDISINLIISLKWSIWAYNFLNEISENIVEYKQYEMFDKNIGEDIIREKNIKHELILDDTTINSKEEFIKLMEEDYNAIIFDENTKIHFKLKMGLKEYLIISNTLTPVFLKYL